ncbi:serine hydrolase [Sphingomonas sp. ASV193]|uniref:serine hydrolase n=1 Tax=Sphingomonas sp. ASV193 TaxID=3144405 RepID=UPI0032E8604B
MIKARLFFASLALLAAQPALAEAPPRLATLEQQLSAIAAANPGNIGIAALDLNSGELVSIHGDTPFPMASTVKVAIASNYMAQVEAGRRSLDDTIKGVPARVLIGRMLIHSDNVATDMVLGNLGGPRFVQSWLATKGVTGLRIDRTIAQLLAARRDLHDVRDSATPKAMVQMLRMLDRGSLLQPSSRSFILSLMASCETGKNRMRALLPWGTPVEHKTGTLTGLADDVGFITLPDGRRLAIAIFTRKGNNRPATIAQAARTIYDGFLNSLKNPFGYSTYATQ